MNPSELFSKLQLKNIKEEPSKTNEIVLPIPEEAPKDWDVVTFRVPFPVLLIKQLLHLTIVYAFHTLGETEISPIKEMFAPYLDEEITDSFSEGKILKEVSAALKNAMDSLTHSVFLPITEATDKKTLFFQRAGTVEPGNYVQPMIMTEHKADKNSESFKYNLLNGYTTSTFYPYCLTVKQYDTDHWHGSKVVMIKYFMLPALTSVSVREDIRNYLTKSPTKMKDKMIDLIIKAVRQLCNLRELLYDTALWISLLQLSKRESRKLDTVQEQIGKLCSYPSVVEFPQAYGAKKLLTKSKAKIHMSEFLKGLFFAQDNGVDPAKTSEYEASLFFFILYLIIEKKQAIDCTFVIECTNEKTLILFYRHLAELLAPFNLELNPEKSFVKIRHNISSIEDMNRGQLDNYERLKGSLSRDVKRALIGFAHVNSHTLQSSKIGNKSTQILFIMHLCNFYDKEKSLQFAETFLDRPMFWSMMTTIFERFTQTNIEISEATLKLWSNQCVREIADAMHIFEQLVPTQEAETAPTSSSGPSSSFALSANRDFDASTRSSPRKASLNLWGNDDTPLCKKKK